MTLTRKLLAALLVSTVGMSATSCTTMKTISPATEPTAPVFGKVKPGDRVAVHMRDGRQEQFVVDRVDGDSLVSTAGFRYARGEIAELKRRSFSPAKTTGLVCATTAATFALVLIAAIATWDGPVWAGSDHVNPNVGSNR
jgi:hypothetical protein